MPNFLRSSRLLPGAALVVLFLAACQRPHVCHTGCESGLVASAPAPAAPPPAPATPAAAAAGTVELAAEPATRQTPAAPELEASAALAAFDEAWETIRDTHFDQSFNGVDWDALKSELRPRAEQARSHDEVRAVISDMLARLGQSHFALIPSDALPDQAGAHDQAGGLGFDVRLRDGRLLVVSLDPKGHAAAAGVKLGWGVQRIGAFDVPVTLARMQGAAEELGPRMLAFQAWSRAQAELLGPVGSRASVAFLDAEDRAIALELERRARDVTSHSVGSTLPTFFLEFRSEILARGEQKIGLVRFSNWFLPVMAQIDEAVERMRVCDAIVIDLRGNTGGAGAMAMGVAGHFFAEPKKLGTMITRDSTMNFLANPRRVNPAGELVEPFAGLLAVLVDETTASTSEMFAGGLQSLGRARIFGETTVGAVLPAMTTRLPNGDSMLHALGDFETSTGVRLEGTGVVPDQVVPLVRDELLAGRDATLESALAWIASGGR